MTPPSELLVTIVAIDDDQRTLQLIQDIFSAEPGVSVVCASDAPSGLEAVRRFRPGIVLLDLIIPGSRRYVRARRHHPFLSGNRRGADYRQLLHRFRRGGHPQGRQRLPHQTAGSRASAANASVKLLETARRRARASRLNAELMETCQFQGMVGCSPLMLEVFDRIRRAAPHFRTALVTGPTGTGKELAARALHRLSPVQSKNLAVSNCSAIVETLFESELFGHVKGGLHGRGYRSGGLFRIRRRVARFSWMRSATCRSPPKPNCSA